LFSCTQWPSTHTHPRTLHAALPISPRRDPGRGPGTTATTAADPARTPPTSCRNSPPESHQSPPEPGTDQTPPPPPRAPTRRLNRSEEHTSELQSRENLVCRPLLEKK